MLREKILNVCELFEKHEVQYILIGGVAVALNGYYRPSMNSSGDLTDKPDIDVWFNPTYENYYKVLKVLRDLNYDTTFFEEEQAPDPQKSFFKIDFEDFTFDLLPSIKANIKFIEAYKRKVTVKTNDINVCVLSYTDLIKDKEANARPKDLEDIRQLKNLKKNQ